MNVRATRAPTRLTEAERSLITGLVLAGGLSRRMSAEGLAADKGLALLDGRPLAAHVLARLAPQVGPVLISANRNTDRYAAFGHPVLADVIDGYAGPLAGMHAGLGAADTPWVATAPCDTPFLPADLVARLWLAAQAAPGGPARAAVARTVSGQLQPVFALLDRRLLPGLQAFLAAGHRRVDAWHASLPAVVVDFPDESAFLGIDTPTDLARSQSR